jgi:hypothetical protein
VCLYLLEQFYYGGATTFIRTCASRGDPYIVNRPKFPVYTYIYFDFLVS